MKIFYQFQRDFQKLVLLTILALCLSGSVVYATVYTVNNVADGNGLNQLRGALMSAGNTPGTHTVNVSSGKYFIDLNHILFGTASNVNITINGAGTGSTVIDGRGQSRGFAINPNNNQTNVKVTFNGMTIQNCTSTSTTGGGGIVALGGLENAYNFNNCLFFNNRAYSETADASGGAILCLDASLSIVNCTFSSNSSDRGSGGAVAFQIIMGTRGQVSGALSIANSGFSFNSVGFNSAGGGAVSADIVGSGGTFSTSITECSFTQNAAALGYGGAIAIYDNLGGSPVAVNYNRFLGNVARPDYPTLSAVVIEGGSGLFDAKNNWWGCNDGAAACADQGWSSTGAATFTPHLQLKTTLNAQSICLGTSSAPQITTGFTSNSANQPIAASSLDALVGRNVLFVVPGSMGSATGAQTKIQANGLATANFSSNGTPGLVNIYSLCDGASSANTPLTVNAPGTWLGTSSADWYLPANWCGGAIPIASTNVVIPAGAPHAPFIKSNFTAAIANNITIAAGATLSLDVYGALEVKGDFVNSGTYNGNAEGAYTLFSGAAQTLPGGNYSVLGIGGGNKTLGANVTVGNYFLFLNDVKMVLGNSNLTFGGASALSDFNSARYFITNGTGGLKKNNIGSPGFTFPVGTETSYTPIVLSNSGSTDNFTVRVGEGVYESYLNNIPQGGAITSKAVNKTWYISEDVLGGSNVELSVYWNSGDELPGFDHGNCFVSHYENNIWGTALSGMASGTNPYFKSRSGLTSFSPFSVNNPGSPLPVTLSRFEAVREENMALLSWSTTEETNSDRFEVERSVNGRHWQNIGIVRSGGDSEELTDYHFVDKYPVLSQENLYRLRMVDRATDRRDGTFAYSRIRSLKFDGVEDRVVYPNPVTDRLLVRDFGQVSTLRIMDMTGMVVYQTSGLEETGIQVDKLSAGLHVVEITWKDGRNTVRKVLIE